MTTVSTSVVKKINALINLLLTFSYTSPRKMEPKIAATFIAMGIYPSY